MKTFTSYIQLRENNETLGWHLVGEKDGVLYSGDGPYKNKEEARFQSNFKNWYDPNNYSILYGYTDDNDHFIELER
jgi:hypothetical protein